MKNLARFGEYSMTGALLWLNFIVFTTIIFYHPIEGLSTIESTFHLWQGWINTTYSTFSSLDSNDSLSRSLSSSLTALIIIIIFCSGLLLNLMSPIFCTPFEMFVFKRKLTKENYSWMDQIIAEHTDFMEDDYATFKSEPLFTFKNLKQIQQQQVKYNKIYLFLNSYLYTNSNSSQLELITENIRIWRISRALTTSLIVMCILLNILVLTESLFLEEPFYAAMLTIVIPVLLYLLSIIITATMFSRLIDNIFSQTYHTHKKLLTSSK